MRREVAELSGDLADLTERFARFQKREGMRAARSEKETNQSLREQAMAILAQQQAPTDPQDIKAQLRQRLMKQ